jgi:aryl sulfotransferase
MKPIYWLASYPKSGNTWLRMLLNGLALGPEDALDINDLPVSGGIASARPPFERLTLLDSELLTADEADCLRPRVYEALAEGGGEGEDDAGALPVRFVKAHDAYVSTPKGEPLLAGARGAAGALLIVRDPRAVAPSLAHHMGVSVDEAIAAMNDPDFCFGVGGAKRSSQFRQKLLGWSGHAASWLDQRDIPLRLLRYEDLAADAGAVLSGALAFAGLAASAEEIGRAVRMAEFSELGRQERESGFREAPRGLGRSFFRRGRADSWREELSPAQIARIERDHAAMMRRLGYEAAGCGRGLRP